VDLDLVSRSQVSASLGQQALDQGLIAGIAGFAIVAIFLSSSTACSASSRRCASASTRLPLRAHQAHPGHADAARASRA
jgi:hypothetical protein